MIAKNFRLKRGEISYLLKKGMTQKSKLFIIRYAKSNLGNSRYAITASAKFNAKAVDRNRIRRQAYEAIRLITKTNILKPHDLVLIPKKQIFKSDFVAIKADIERIVSDLADHE
ncbi:MAG: ribonuclease P protein component [Candidatus Gracilibacteria bacterium]